MRWSAALLLLLLLLLLTAGVLRVSAQVSDLPRLPGPPELVAKRREHLTAVERATEPVTSRYVKMLLDLKQTYTLEKNLQGVEAVLAELKKLPDEAKESALRAPGRGKIIQGVSIVSAQYRDVTRRHSFDITERVRRVFESGTPSLLMSTRDCADGRDPLVGRAKEALVVYIVEGERKEVIIPEGGTLNFKTDLK